MSITLPWRIPSFGPQIQTSLTQPEAEELLRLARGKKVLEIGAAYGYSTVLMASVAHHVLSIDPHQVHQSEDVHTWNLRHSGVEHKVGRIIAPSRQALPPLDDHQFDFIFVDGDHTASGVAFDIEQAIRLAKIYGKIAFHDWDEATCPDVKMTLQMWWREPEYIIDTLAVYQV